MLPRATSPNVVNEEWESPQVLSPSLKTPSLSPPKTKSSSLECSHRRTWSACYRDGAYRKNVQVLVSGSSFSLHPQTFIKLRALDWTWSAAHTNSKDKQEVDVEDGIYRLQMDPVVFETLISHVAFKSMPRVQDLDTAKLEALKEAASVLALVDLQQFLQRGGKNTRASRRHRKELSFGPKSDPIVRHGRLTPSEMYEVSLIV